MKLRRLLLLSGLVLASGCTWPVRENTDDVVCHLIDHPFDVAPERAREIRKSSSDAHERDSNPSTSRSGEKTAPVPEVPIDVQTTAWMESKTGPARLGAPLKDDKVRITAWIEPQPEPSRPGGPQRKLDLNIPPRLPRSEAPRIEVPSDPDAVQREIPRIYPPLEPLPVEPKVQPGPEGKPYTLADLQRL